MIIADSHEPEKYRKIASETRNIEVFDYIVEGEFGKFVIERKTVDDLINSRNDGRLWSQLESLAATKKEGCVPLLVIVGNWGKLFKMKKITLKDYFAIQTAIAKYDVGMITLYNDSFFVAYIKYLNEKVGRKTKRTLVNIPKPKGRTIEEERRDMLLAVSGIGVKTAEELLARFNTIRAVVNSGRDELEGVLKSRTDHFLEVIG
jgi:ERCC4-type nuclease